MLYNFQRTKLCRQLLVGGALFVAAFGMNSCSDTYDLDSDQPSNLNSIYGYMQDQGNFKTCLRLIDDLGEAEVLSKTGSKTMFIANDDAFEEFFKSNSWGIKSYEKLSVAQKKLLLYSAMIDNPYSTSMLSTAEGPVKGEVCRRSSSVSLYDSVLAVKSTDSLAAKVLPQNSRFDEIKHNHDTIVMYTDASNSAPMIHFTYKFLASNKITDADVDFLYNQPVGTHKNDDVYVNNAKVIKPNIFCKNGFIHQVDRVIMPLDNMADIIRKDPETQLFSGILDRFAAPDYDKSYSMAYWGGTEKDSVFIKRYFSDRSNGSTRQSSTKFEKDKNNNTFDASLKFDPGWNAYMPLSGDPRDAMMEDMAVMLVPTDSALRAWFETGGKVIKDYYTSIENTPSSVLDNLVNVNMLESLVGSVPSRFQDVLNDANEALGLSLDSIKSVTLGCNGVVYKTTKVYAPTAYKSVLFPAVIDTANFKIIENAISCLDYDKYLNSMVSRYIFLVPTNEGLLSYVDPVSYGQKESQLWEFHFDQSKEKNKRIFAEVYKCNLNETTGKWEKTGDKIYTVQNQDITAKGTALYDRMENLLDNIIVTTDYQPGRQYYRTKGNTFVRVEGINDGDRVWGSFQTEREYPLHVIKAYPGPENGVALILDGPIMGTRKSVEMCLAEHEEFSEFLGILRQSGALNPSNSKDKWAAATPDGFGNLFNLKTYGDVGAEKAPAGTSSKEKASYLLNNYHYTVYAPVNSAMQKAYEMGLPTVDDLIAAEAYDLENSTDSASLLREVMLDFVKYHIQDNSIFVDNGFESASYESAKTELIGATGTAEQVKAENINGDVVTIGAKTYPINSVEPDEYGTYTVSYATGNFSPGRPYKIKVNVSASGMTVTDNIGEKHNVVTTPGLYNIQAAEYWIASVGTGTSAKVMGPTDNPYQYYINNSSSAVIQAIDGPLVYADGNHYDAKGTKVATQFKYKYKPLAEVKRR